MLDLLPHVNKSTEPQPASPRRRRWLWWLGAAVLLLAVLGAVLATRLDPWLRRTLERQVAAKSQGRFVLRIGDLQTNWRRRSITLRRVQLNPASGSAAQNTGGSARAEQPAPWLLLTIDEVRVAGIGLGALLRGEVVNIDTVLVRTVRARMLRTPEPASSQPLHAQLPKRIPGVRVGMLALDDVRVTSEESGVARARLRQGRLRAHDVLVSRGGATDSSRLAYAARLDCQLAGLEARMPGHRISLGQASFSSRRRLLRVDSLRVMPVADKQAKPGSARVALWLPRATLSGVRQDLLPRRVLRADSLRLSTLQLTFDAPRQQPPPLHVALAPYLRRLQLRHARLTDGRLLIRRVAAQPEVERLNLTGTDIRVDAAAARDPQRVLYARDWTADAGPVQMLIDGPYYRLRSARSALSTRAGSFRATDLRLRPTMAPDEMARRKGHQASHITLRLPELRFSGFDYGALARRGALLARVVELRGARMSLISNAKYPINQQPSIVTPENLGKLPCRLDVRTLRVTDLGMYFTFIGKRANRPGTFRVTRLSGVGTNITNDPRRMSAARPAVLRATAYLQGRCRLQATAWLPLLDRRGTHRVEGTFSPTPFAILNPITEPTRYARFERGQMQQLRVRLLVNRQGVRGTMWARYSDLKVDILSNKGGGPERQTLATKAASKVINTLLIRNDNPRRPDQPLKPGTVRSDRDLRSSVFLIWLQGLNSGLLNSVGVPKKMAQELSEL